MGEAARVVVDPVDLVDLLDPVDLVDLVALTAQANPVQMAVARISNAKDSAGLMRASKPSMRQILIHKIPPHKNSPHKNSPHKQTRVLIPHDQTASNSKADPAVGFLAKSSSVLKGG